MWNCYWGYNNGQWNWFPGHGVVGMLFNIVLLIAAISLIIYLVRRFAMKNNNHRDRRDSLEILKVKYADGAISEEEYQRMRDILLS